MWKVYIEELLYIELISFLIFINETFMETELMFHYCLGTTFMDGIGTSQPNGKKFF